MRIANRLSSLEARVPRRGRRELSDEYLLVMFETMGRHGYYDREPDFPQALAFYRHALQDARKQTDPPFNPPADFQPHNDQHRREVEWRSEARFPAVRQGWWWLMEMWIRRRDGIPPVSEAEFAELGAWFNDTDVDWNFGLVNGRQIYTHFIREGLRKGPRAWGAGKTAEDIRQLRSHLAHHSVGGGP